MFTIFINLSSGCRVTVPWRLQVTWKGIELSLVISRYKNIYNLESGAPIFNSG